jgi:hypothetical protein
MTLLVFLRMRLSQTVAPLVSKRVGKIRSVVLLLEYYALGAARYHLGQ